MRPAHQGATCRVELRHLLVEHEDVARRREVEAREQVQERGLPGAGGAGHGRQPTRVQLDGQIAEDVLAPVVLGKADRPCDNGTCRGVSHRWGRASLAVAHPQDDAVGSALDARCWC